MLRRLAKTSILVLTTTGLLAGCGGDDEKRADQAAQWLQDTAQLTPMPYGWKLGDVTALGANGVEMDVHLATLEQENTIRAMAQMKRFAAVQGACPENDAEIWSLLSSKQKLWLNLIGVSGNRLTRGNCWRR